MKVLIACEFSGVVRDEFRRSGYDAWSADLLPTESEGPHIVGDVREILGDGWDLMIAHPPCQYLANSGVRWLYRGGKGTEYKNEERWEKMEEAAHFFRTLLHAPIPFVAVENPVMHRYGRGIVGMDYAQTIQPYQFGETESKRTGLWLRGLPPLLPTKIMPPPRYSENGKPLWDNQTPSGQNRLPPSEDRWKLRSRTYPGIARAMADQWGRWVEEQLGKPV